MASYALIPILSGFAFDMPKGHIGFDPYQKDSFRCIWSLADAWGVFELDKNVARIMVYEGEITLKSIGVKFFDTVSHVIIDGTPIDFKLEKGSVCFESKVIRHGVEIVR